MCTKSNNFKDLKVRLFELPETLSNSTARTAHHPHLDISRRRFTISFDTSQKNKCSTTKSVLPLKSSETSFITDPQPRNRHSNSKSTPEYLNNLNQFQLQTPHQKYHESTDPASAPIKRNQSRRRRQCRSNRSHSTRIFVLCNRWNNDDRSKPD